MSDVPSVPGASEVVEWFGFWPSFHDAEITRVHLNRSRPSYIDVHTFRMTSELTASGHYLCDKHAIVTFELVELLEVNLQDFNHQNVVSGIDIASTESGFQLIFEGCYGLVGSVSATTVKLSLSAGVPDDSVYQRTAFDASHAG